MRARNKVPNFDPMLCTLSVVTQFEFNILKLKKKKNISRFSWKLLSLSYLIYKKRNQLLNKLALLEILLDWKQTSSAHGLVSDGAMLVQNVLEHWLTEMGTMMPQLKDVLFGNNGYHRYVTWLYHEQCCTPHAELCWWPASKKRFKLWRFRPQVSTSPLTLTVQI